MSVKHATKHGYQFVFNDAGGKILSNEGKEIAAFAEKNNLYLLNLAAEPVKSYAAVVKSLKK